jgi:hypothetical protein
VQNGGTIHDEVYAMMSLLCMGSKMDGASLILMQAGIL